MGLKQTYNIQHIKDEMEGSSARDLLGTSSEAKPQRCRVRGFSGRTRRPHPPEPSHRPVAMDDAMDDTMHRLPSHGPVAADDESEVLALSVHEAGALVAALLGLAVVEVRVRDVQVAAQHHRPDR